MEGFRRKRSISQGWVASLLLLMFSVAGSAHAQEKSLTPIHLTLGMRSNPVGISPDGLTFGWTLDSGSGAARSLRQSGYRVIVASSGKALATHRGDVWDSGRVASKTYWQLPYAGQPLHAHTTYFWQVQAWGGSSRPGAWSKAASFTTGLEEKDWTARWIAAAPDGQAKKDGPLPVFRGGFKPRGPIESALVFVTGLGQYELDLNGADVTKTVMNPGWTNYRKTVPYDTYDVTGLLRRGVNSFAMMLGNGMYNVEEEKNRYTKFIGSFGQPKARLQMEVRYADGSAERFISNSTWKTHAGPISFSSIYGGEDEDARALPADWKTSDLAAQGWPAAVEVPGPGGVMSAEESSPMVIAEVYKARSVTTLKPGVTVYDLGETMSGWPALVVQGNAGARVTLLPGELLAKDGSVSQRSTNAFPADPVLYRYTLRGGAAQESWHPRFSYHSFRYVQVTVEPASMDAELPHVLSVAGDFVHAQAPVVGEFQSSNDLFNRIHQLIDRAVLSNLASVVTDCPSREKLGWLEQTYLNAGTLMWNYDVTGLYEKMSHDMADAQLADGLVPSIAPEYVAFVEAGKNTPFRDSPEWGSAVILSPWELYRFTGDRRPLVVGYGTMQRYAAYLDSRLTGGLLSYGLGDWYDIGPGAPGPSQLTSTAVTATGVYYEDLVTLARIAELLGKSADAADYTRRAAAVRESFNAKLFHPEANQYDRGSQTAEALPLALGLVPPGHEAAVLQHLVADIHQHGDHVTAGDVGFHYVVRALTEGGRSDVLAAMFSRTDAPSYGYQLAQGATTLTEAWDANPDSSQNHFMLGHGEEWFYRGLAGLSFDLSHGPDDAITLRPSLLPGVDHASASFLSVEGLIVVAWQRTQHAASVQVTVPAGAQAHLLLPALGVWQEGNAPIDRAAGVLSEPNKNELVLGSGQYHFSVSITETPLTATEPHD